MIGEIVNFFYSACYKYRTCVKKGIYASECNTLRDNRYDQTEYGIVSTIGDCYYSCEKYKCNCSTCYS